MAEEAAAAAAAEEAAAAAAAEEGVAADQAFTHVPVMAPMGVPVVLALLLLLTCCAALEVTHPAGPAPTRLDPGAKLYVAPSSSSFFP